MEAVSIRGLAADLDVRESTLRSWGVTADLMTRPDLVRIAVKASPGHNCTVDEIWRFLLDHDIQPTSWLLTVDRIHYCAASLIDAASIIDTATRAGRAATYHLSPIGEWR